MSFSSPMRVLCAIPRSRPTSLLRSSSATAPRTIAVLPAIHQRSFHAAPPTQRSKPAPRESHRPTDISELDVLGSAPIPSTNIEATLPGGFLLNSGLGIFDGAGALLVGGEAFAWKPWLAKGEEGEKENAMRLVNAKGQFDLPAEAFSALSLLWPRPGKSRQQPHTSGQPWAALGRRFQLNIC